MFAIALRETLPEEGYELRRLGSGEETDAYHVCAYKNGFLVDALGIRREEDVLAYLSAKLGTEVKSLPCQEEDLTTRASDKDRSFKDCIESGPLNVFGLSTHPEYVAYLRAKAKMVILDTPDRYQVSFLLEDSESRDE